MLTTINSGKLSQSLVDEGRHLLSALRKLDANVASWVKRCLGECGSKDVLRSEWKKHLGLDHDNATVLIGCYEAWNAIPDKALWVAIGLQGINKIRTVRAEARAPIVEKIKTAVANKETVSLEDVRKLVDKVRRTKPATKVVRFVAGRSDKHSISGETLEALRKLFEENPDLAQRLPDVARLELGLE